MANIYVATDGNDGNAGDGPASGDAYATMGQAASVVAAGDIVYLVTRNVGDTFTNETGTVQLATAGTDPAGAIQWLGANTEGRADGTMAVFDFAGKTLTANEGAVHIDADYQYFEHISVENAGSGNHGWRIDDSAINEIIFVECDGRGNASRGFYSIGGKTVIFIHCIAANNGNIGFQSATQAGQKYYACIATDNGTDGFNLSADGEMYFCISAHNNKGVTNPSHMINCTIYGNTNDGIGKGGEVMFASFINNIIANNGGYGYDPKEGSGDHEPAILINNAFWNNGSGKFNPGPTLDTKFDHEIGTIDLGTNPFINPDFNDFTLNNNAEGGQLCKGAGTAFNYHMNTRNTLDLGAIQSQQTFLAG